MNNQRESWVDYAKAIGIILVVYGHIARGLYNANVPMNEDIYKLLDTFIYSFHMPLFFFLSGLYFIKSLTNRTTKQFVFNKIDTIVYPYILWSLIQGIIEATISSQTNGSATYPEVFSLLWQPRAHFWFLYALALVMLFGTLFYRYFNVTKASILVLIGFILFISKGYFPFSIYTNYIFSNFIYLALGMYFQQSSINNKLEMHGIPLLITSLFIGTQYLILFHSIQTPNALGITPLITTIIAITMMIVISKLLAKRDIAVLKLIGTTSMGIYLLHILVGSSVRIFLQKVVGNNTYELHLIVGILSGILFPLIFVLLSKKVKMPLIESAPISKLITSFIKRVKYPHG
jgi:fucose 4-O-acetylase-like acetyltransferase